MNMEVAERRFGAEFGMKLDIAGLGFSGDELSGVISPYRTDDKHSFAYESVIKRWPIIVTGAIDDVHRTTSNSKDDTERSEGKAIVEALAKLKYEMQHDRQLLPLSDDGQADIELYNSELEQRGAPTWHHVSWLYSECYLYRRMATVFATTKKWKNYDIFARQKISTFKSSRPAVLELASRYKEIVLQLQDKSKKTSPEESAEAERILFAEMCEICLWGNATDLSLLTNLSYEDIQKLQGSTARKAAEANILVNDLPKAFEILKKAQTSQPDGIRRVDIVLDNAGFELYVDLILAGYLITAGLATNIVLHPKSIPWFVSDVLPTDFSALLGALADPQAFYSALESGEADNDKVGPLSQKDADNLHFLFEHWSGLHGEGQLTIRPNRFWTHAGSYWRLPTIAPELTSDLRESELVIFKGDLNYRKLTGDVAWHPTVSFEEAIGPLAKTGTGLRVLALRTCKADVVAGLPAGRDGELQAMEGGGGDSGARRWAWTGKWALVQFCDGR